MDSADKANSSNIHPCHGSGTSHSRVTSQSDCRKLFRKHVRSCGQSLPQRTTDARCMARVCAAL